MKARRRSPAMLAALATLAGCSFVEIDEPSVCETLSNEKVAALPPDAGVQTVVVPLGLNIHKELGTPTGNGSVQFTSFVLTAVSGVTGFGFIESAELDLVVGEADAGSVVPLGTYQEVAGASPSSALTLSGNGSNVYTYVKTGAVSLSLRIVGTPPPVAWTFDAEICVHIAVDE